MSVVRESLHILLLLDHECNHFGLLNLQLLHLPDLIVVINACMVLHRIVECGLLGCPPVVGKGPLLLHREITRQRVLFF